MRQPSPRRPRSPVLNAAGRLLLLFGGLTLALRYATPRPAGHADRRGDYDGTGRGPPSTPPSRAARAEGHETEDFSGAVLGRLVLMLFVVATCVGFGMWGLGRVFENAQTNARPPLTTQQTTHLQPPAPNVQNDPLGDIARLRAKENTLLTNYGWNDTAHTSARIPIDRAMTLMVGKPLDTAP